MIYATYEDMTREMPIHTLAEYVAEGGGYDAMVNGELPEAEQAIVDGALSDASELIDSYVLTRYPNLDTPPPLLRKCCARLAVTYLVDRKFIGNGTISEWAQRLRAEQTALLEKIAKGVITLGVAPEAEKGNVEMVVSERIRLLDNVY
jgi:phage gp36-like protein